MATSTATSLPRMRGRALAREKAWLAVPVGLGALAAVSVLLRTARFSAGFWVDEGLSVGIADRPLTDIPGVMRLDGSPPLYYMLLHLWMRGLGVRSEVALHSLSLVFAILAIPVAWALARDLFGDRAGWVAAVLVAVNPFLTQYAQETRMYSLVVLLAIAACAGFVGAFALDRGRRWVVGFALAQVVLLYTHNWGLFLGAGLAAAWAALMMSASPERRRALVRDGLLAAAIVLVLYAPWLPTLAFQAGHTGAPWARPPNILQLVWAPMNLLGDAPQYLLLLGTAAGLATLVRGPVRRWGPQARAALALLIVLLVGLSAAWLSSSVSPAWALRYLAIGLGPIVLLCALGLSRAGLVGLCAVALAGLVSLGLNGPKVKSNVRSVAEAIAPGLAAGDLVVTTQPEQAPVLHYYLEDVGGLRWATLTGPLTDLGVTDWRDGTRQLEATSVERDLEPLLTAVEPGQRVALIAPDFAILKRWKAPWSELVRTRSIAWEEAMRNDSRFRVLAVEPPNPVARANEVRATVFLRQSLESRAPSRWAGAASAPLASHLP